MRVSVVLPSIDLTSDPDDVANVNGANLALWIQLRTYANHPAFQGLELFLSPNSMADPEGIRRFGTALLEPENRGRGRLTMRSIYALSDHWSDGADRLLHTHDLSALWRDHRLRELHARGTMLHLCDTHCLGHAPIHRALRDVATSPGQPGDLILACSSTVAAALETTYGGAIPYDIVRLPRRIDATGLGPVGPEEKVRIRRELGLPADRKLAVFVGRVTPAMKAELLLLVDALGAIPDVPFDIVIAGVSNMEGYDQILRDRAAALGVGERLHLTGRFSPSQRALWYQAADLFVFPGDCINDAYPQTPIEAMACGVPALGSDWDGLKDTIVDGCGERIPTFACAVPERLTATSLALEARQQFFVIAQSVVIDRERWFARLRAWLTDDRLRDAAAAQSLATFQEHHRPAYLEQAFVEVILAQFKVARAGGVRAVRTREIPVEVDYDTILRIYASQLIGPNDRFCDTESGIAWRAGGKPPSVYGQTEAFLDLDLLRAIIRVVEPHSLSAGQLSTRCAVSPITPKDVVYHAMFLAKQGFLRLELAS